MCLELKLLIAGRQHLNLALGSSVRIKLPSTLRTCVSLGIGQLSTHKTRNTSNEDRSIPAVTESGVPIL